MGKKDEAFATETPCKAAKNIQTYMDVAQGGKLPCKTFRHSNIQTTTM
jgi:hypothetical protein